MTPEQIEKLSEEEILDLMRREGVEVSHSLFGTVHFKSPSRPQGYSEADLDEISEDLDSADLRRWRRELADHFAKKANEA